MAFGDFLHKVASVIGLEADKSRNDGYDDYDYDDYDNADAKVGRSSNRYTSGGTGRSFTPPRASQPQGAAYENASSYARKPSQSAYGTQTKARDPYDNIVQMPDRGQYASQAPASAPAPVQHTQHGTVIVYVSRKDDTESIMNYVLNGRSVILSCERIDDATTQRVIDILSGSAYSLSGHVEKISKGNYLFAPASVEIYSTENKAQQPYGFAGEPPKKTAAAGGSKYGGVGGSSVR
ncbi:MAG: cell division protein SepF [Oscillospiraceae bacterium]|jgi:cell division inhibitor SepF|nr:cell division protein SepF [Oscillospiraceae bacterium]